uniref:LuxR C-terminal-related transcriptional regulator n=1 Tax=uncultured Draconibacterium sp. TaxID=1573823 RepID=UPI0032170B98
MKHLQKSIKDHSRIFENICIRPEDIDYEKAEREFLPFLRLIDSLQTSIVIAFDFYKRDYFYFSKNFNSIFGFHNNCLPLTDHKWFRQRFHPDDYIINTGSIWTLKYFYQLPVEERKNIRLIHEFRIKNDNNEWIRLLIQNEILELDKKGNMWLDLKLCDFSPNQDLDMPGHFILRNKLSGEVIYSVRGNNPEVKNVSSREQEVLSLISEGMKSKEIADKLFISANTVNNHRRNLIEKLNVSNSSEAVKMATTLGII